VSEHRSSSVTPNAGFPACRCPEDHSWRCVCTLRRGASKSASAIREMSRESSFMNIARHEDSHSAHAAVLEPGLLRSGAGSEPRGRARALFGPRALGPAVAGFASDLFVAAGVLDERLASRTLALSNIPGSHAARIRPSVHRDSDPCRRSGRGDAAALLFSVRASALPSRAVGDDLLDSKSLSTRVHGRRVSPFHALAFPLWGRAPDREDQPERTVLGLLLALAPDPSLSHPHLCLFGLWQAVPGWSELDEPRESSFLVPALLTGGSGDAAGDSFQYGGAMDRRPLVALPDRRRVRCRRKSVVRFHPVQQSRTMVF